MVIYSSRKIDVSFSIIAMQWCEHVTLRVRVSTESNSVVSFFIIILSFFVTYVVLHIKWPI